MGTFIRHNERLKETLHFKGKMSKVEKCLGSSSCQGVLTKFMGEFSLKSWFLITLFDRNLEKDEQGLR